MKSSYLLLIIPHILKFAIELFALGNNLLKNYRLVYLEKYFIGKD